MAKAKTPTEEKFDKQDFDLFDALKAIDKKDYSYFDTLTVEQQKKFSPYMLLQWMVNVKSNSQIQDYYLRSVEYHANKYMLDYMIASNSHKHSKLQWLMLCAASPGIGSQFRQWIPSISPQVSKLRVSPKEKDIKEYYKKIYPNTDNDTLDQISKLFIVSHKKKMYLAQQYPSMKVEDIEILAELVSDSDIEQYDRQLGN